jgi:hypothetical protein
VFFRPSFQQKPRPVRQPAPVKISLCKFQENRNDFVYPFLFTEMKYLSKQAALAMILDILQFSHSVNGINSSGLGYSTSGV